MRHDNENRKGTVTLWNIKIRKPDIRVAFQQERYNYQCVYGTPFTFTIDVVGTKECREITQPDRVYMEVAQGQEDNIQWVNPLQDGDLKYSLDGMVSVKCITRSPNTRLWDPL